MGGCGAIVSSWPALSWCWWSRQYAPGDTVLEGLENHAREAKKGLWVVLLQVPPWDWRER